MDAFTMELELCDEDGLVDLEQHNRLCELGGHPKWDGAPFACTGSAHLAGEHVRCTSPYHERPPVVANPLLQDAASVYALARQTREFVQGASADDPDVAWLLEAADASERVARRLYFQRSYRLDELIEVRGVSTRVDPAYLSGTSI